MPSAPSPRGTVWPAPPTEVDVFYSWPLGVGDILAEGLQDLLLHLAKRVCVHGSDTQGVHPTALEGDVEVLWTEAALGVSGAPMDAQSSGAEVRQNKGCHLQFTASKSADLCSLAIERCNLLMEPRGHREQCCALLSCCPALGLSPDMQRSLPRREEDGSASTAATSSASRLWPVTDGAIRAHCPPLPDATG